MHYSRIAWSRNGLLAYINSENKVFVTWLNCLNGEEWQFVPPKQLPVPTNPTPIALSWSLTNYNLSVCDKLGRIHIVDLDSVSQPVNLITASAVKDQRVRPVELDGLVGSHWLENDKNLLVPQLILDADNESQISASKSWESINPRGPTHPLKSRSALACVNGNGMFRFLVQQQDQKYSEVDTLIPGIKSVLTACFLQYTKQSLLMFAICDNFRLLGFEIKINWNPNVTVKINRISDQYLGELRPFRVNAHYTKRDQLELSVVYRDEIKKFALSSHLEDLNNSFLELFTMSQPVTPEPQTVWKLEELESLDCREDNLTSFIPLRYVNLMVHKSGRVSTQPVYNGAVKLQFNNFGFGYDPSEMARASDICFTPTGLCAVGFLNGLTNEPKLMKPSFDKDAVSTTNANTTSVNGNIINAAKCLATAYTCTVFNAEQCDDILQLALSSLKKLEQKSQFDFFNTLVSESQRLLNVNLTPPEDQRMIDRLVIIPSPPQRWLSFLVSLGTRLNWQKSDGGKAAYILLHLQLLAFGLTWTVKKMSQRTKTNDVKVIRQEISTSVFYINSMLGPIRWATDLIARFCQEIYDLHLRSQQNPEILTSEPNVYSSVLMSSVARYLLRYFLRGIRTLTTSAKGLAELENRLNANVIAMAKRSLDPQQSQDIGLKIKNKLMAAQGYCASQTIKKIIVQLHKSPINLDAFEKLLVDINEKSKMVLTQANLADHEQKDLDAKIVKFATVPSVYQPVIKHVMDVSKNMLFANADVPNLYFYDTSWLGIDLNNGQQQYMVDGLRKRLMLSTDRINYCTRCGMQSLAIEPNKQAIQWLLLFQRHCICGGFWTRSPHNEEST